MASLTNEEKFLIKTLRLEKGCSVLRISVTKIEEKRLAVI